MLDPASVSSNTSCAHVGRQPYHAHRNPAGNRRDRTGRTEPDALDNTAPSWIDACSWEDTHHPAGAVSALRECSKISKNPKLKLRPEGCEPGE